MTFNIPQEPFLTKILQLWQESPRRILIRDLSDKHQKEYTVEEFLCDVSTVQQRLYDSLDGEVKKHLRDPDTDVFMGLLAGPGYGFGVLVFAIYCLGGVVVPLTPNFHPEEAKYFLQISNTVLLTTTPAYDKQAQAICNVVGIKVFTFDTTQFPKNLENISFALDTKTPPINPEKGFVLLFSSGTTGLPKGVLHSRRSATIGFSAQIVSFGLTSNDTWLHSSPVHWMGGFMFFMINMVAASCVEFCASRFSHDWLLKRLQMDDSICVYLPPPLLDSMAEKLEMKKSDTSIYENSRKGLRGIRVLVSGSMATSASTHAMWREIRGGKPVAAAYGMTESLGFLAINGGESSVGPLDSAGVRQPHATIKIDESGEICAKTPALFKRYLSSNPDVMKGVFDSEGFYKTGDVGRLENDILYVLGRASQDVICFDKCKIYAPEVEEALTNHPLISRAIVVGKSDPRVVQRTAALLIPRDMNTSQKPSLNLKTLRKWLALDRGLSIFKVPTLLRIAGPGDVVPVTVTDKAIKGKIRDEFFNDEELAKGKVEVWDLAVKEEFGQRPFDWGGVKSS